MLWNAQTDQILIASSYTNCENRFCVIIRWKENKNEPDFVLLLLRQLCCYTVLCIHKHMCIYGQVHGLSHLYCDIRNHIYTVDQNRMRGQEVLSITFENINNDNVDNKSIFFCRFIPELLKIIWLSKNSCYKERGK